MADDFTSRKAALSRFTANCTGGSYFYPVTLLLTTAFPAEMQARWSFDVSCHVPPPSSTLGPHRWVPNAFINPRMQAMMASYPPAHPEDQPNGYKTVRHISAVSDSKRRMLFPSAERGRSYLAICVLALASKP